MNLSVEQARFTEGEAVELADYRPLNKLALASAVLGVLSGLALLHPFLICLAAFGFATGLLAVRQLSIPDSPRTGATLARVGIFLSLLFGFGVGTKELTRQRATIEQARECAERWFELVRQGKLREAHQLTLHPPLRAVAGTSLDVVYAPRTRPRRRPDPSEGLAAEMEMMAQVPEEQLTQFFKGEPAQRLAALGTNATYTYLRTTQQQRSGPVEVMVKQDFGVEAVENGKPVRFVVNVTLERVLTNRIAAWRVVGVSNPQAGT